MDVSAWTLWFLGCLTRAIESAETALSATLAKARFWQNAAHVPLNARASA